jgi:hypothetical protein
MNPGETHINVDGVTEPSLYSPLKTPQSIRLIHARRPDVDEKNIAIDLEQFPLLGPKCPPFTAISYFWGEKKLDPRTVVINGHRCRVLESIYPILALICDAPDVKKDIWFWVDYLCINQDDVHERSEQVALMGMLYRRAERTLVWLGEHTPDVHGALALLKFFASDQDKHRYHGAWLSQYKGLVEEWEGLRHWMTRPW